MIIGATRHETVPVGASNEGQVGTVAYLLLS